MRWSARQHPVALLLALVLPALVLAGAWTWFQRPAEVTGKALAMQRNLRRQPRPEVVVLGSSLARTNVRLDVLAEELGIPQRQVVLLTLPNATSPHWYAILKNRVFGEGYRPKAVVMVGALTTMLTPDVLMDSNVERLVNQLSDDEPVIARKVFRTADPATFRWLYAREQAGQFRDALLERWRDLALGLVFRGGGPERAARLAARANEAVFADEKMNYELHKRQSTGLWVGAVEEITLEGIDIEQESLIPDIAALARAFGSRAVFVRTPFPPSNADNDYVPAAYEAEAVRVMEASGAIYVDLRGLNLDDTYFRDMRHMSREGAAIFTRALARTMKDLGVLEGGDGPSSLRLEPVRVERTPPPDELTRFTGTATRVSRCAWRVRPGQLAAVRGEELARAGHPAVSPVRVRVGDALLAPDGAPDPHRCTPGVVHDAEGLLVVVPEGTSGGSLSLELVADVSFPVDGEAYPAWWVYPGTTLRFSFDTPWPHGDTVDAWLLGHAFGGGDGVPELRVASSVIPFQSRGQRVWAQGSVPVSDSGPWTVEIHTPMDGPWLLLQNLRLGRAPWTTDLVGLPELLAGASIRIVGGRTDDTQVAPRFAGPPPALDVKASPREGPRGVATWALPAFRFLADAPHSREGWPHKCSPLRVLEDGRMLPMPHATCAETMTLKGGRTCHAGNLLYVSGSDGSSPARNGRTYEVVLEPSRICERRNQRNTVPLRGAVWLYPGDHLILDFPDEQLAGFHDGANQLEYALDPIRAEEGDPVRIRLTQDGRPLLDETIAWSGGRREYRKRTLETPLPPRSGGVRLEVINPDPDAWWLLVMATLSESYEYRAPSRHREAEPIAEGDADDTDAPEAIAALVLPEAAPPGPSVAAVPPDVVPLERAGERRPTSWTRTGRIPVVGPPKEPRPVRHGYEAQLFLLWPISNSQLVRQGFGAWSPLRLRDGDRVLRPVPDPAALRACTDCFLHQGKSVVLRDRPAGALEAFLDPDVPSAGPGGEVVWIYPGSGVQLRLEGPWKGDTLEIEAHLATFAGRDEALERLPLLRFPGGETAFETEEEGVVARTIVHSRRGEPVDVELRAHGAGPWLLVTDLSVRDAAGTWTVVRLPDRPVADDDAP